MPQSKTNPFLAPRSLYSERGVFLCKETETAVRNVPYSGSLIHILFCGSRNEFNFDLHSHTGGKALQRPQRRICVAVFQFADVCLSNAGTLRELLLGQAAYLPGIDHCLYQRKLGLKCLPLRFEFRVFQLFVEKIPAGSEAVFEKQSAQAIEEAKKWFRPELVGRLDELIVFRPLAEDSLCAIAEKLLGQLEARAARNGYQLTHTPRVGAVLAAKARSPYGARELRRQVDRAVEQALANQIASGTAHTGQHWTADCTVDGAIVLEEGKVVEQTIG